MNKIFKSFKEQYINETNNEFQLDKIYETDYIKKGMYLRLKSNAIIEIISDLKSNDYWENKKNEYFDAKLDSSDIGGSITNIKLLRNTPLFKEVNKLAKNKK